MAVRAIRAEAQGICSRSPMVLQRVAAYGKRNAPLRCESSVFSRQWSVNRCVMSSREWDSALLIVWPTRRADALPLALPVFMRIIRCPDSSWRDSPVPVVADRG